MGVLNFCDPCGALRVREVRGQLERLVTVKTKPKPSRCGLCKTVLEQKKRVRIKKIVKETKAIKVKVARRAENSSSKVKDASKVEVKVEKRETRLETGSIKPVHFEDLESGNENDSIDIPFDCGNVSPEDSDSSVDTKPVNKPATSKIKVQEKITIPTTATASKNLKKVKKKKADRQEKILTDAELAKRRALDERVLAMVDTDGPKTRSLTCKECKKIFCHIHKFVKHIGSHLDEELKIDLPYICPICNIRAANFLSLDRHMILHKQEKPYVCKWPDCKASFACKRYLTKHIRRHEGHKSYYRRPVNKIRKFKCSKCDYMAISRDTLSFHENTHTQARPFKCEFCDRAFNNPRNRTIHERNMHSKSKDNHYMCESCGYSSFFKADLLKHQRIHTGDKPFACEICDYRSSRRDNLRKHIRIHTGEKKHKCHYCDKVFHSQQTCKEHEMNAHVNAHPVSAHQTKESLLALQAQQSEDRREHEKDIHLNTQSLTIPQPQQSNKDKDIQPIPLSIHQAKESSSIEGPSMSSSSSNPKVPQMIPNPHHPQNLSPPLMLMNNPSVEDPQSQAPTTTGQPSHRDRVYDHSKMEGLVGPFRSHPHQQQPPVAPPGPGQHQSPADRSQSDWIRAVSFLQHLHQM